MLKFAWFVCAQTNEFVSDGYEFVLKTNVELMQFVNLA